VSVEVRRARDAAELEAAYALRIAVFTDEQGVRREADRDLDDEDALHLVAVEDGGAVLGTCRLVVAGGVARLGRLAVRGDARRGGLGAALLADAEREARAAGAREIRLHAQAGAVALYESAGYAAEGDPFDEEGIEHVVMRRELGDA